MEKRVEALGPTGARVAERLNAIRRQRGWTLKQVADKLDELGRPILLSALSKIEKGQRRIDADDLVALALALDVSPNLLLLPGEASPGSSVQLTPAAAKDSADAWSWAIRDAPPQTSAPAWDFFISYTHADRTWAEWIAGQLRDAGYSVWLDAWRIAVGDKLTSAIDQALNQSAALVAVLSPNYLRSNHAKAEWIGALAGRQPARATKLFPVLIEDSDLPALLADVAYLDLRDLTSDEARSRLLNAAGRLRGRKKAPIPPFPGSERASNDVIAVANRWVELGRVDDAIHLLRRYAETGTQSVIPRLIELIASRGDVAEALTLAQLRADAGDTKAIYRLVDVLATEGNVDAAVSLLRHRADAGDANAAARLVDLLEARGGRIDVSATVHGGDSTNAEASDGERTRN